MGKKNPKGVQEARGTKEPKKKGGKKALLVLPVAALIAIVAAMQGCAEDISEALKIFSGGGASGKTQDSTDNPDDKADNPSKEENDKPTPTPAKEEGDTQGAQENKAVQITVSGRQVVINNEEIAYTEDDLTGLSAAVKEKLSGLISDEKTTYLNDLDGDYNVTEAVRRVLEELGITPVEKRPR